MDELVELDEGWFVTKEQFQRFVNYLERLDRVFENMDTDSLSKLEVIEIDSGDEKNKEDIL